MKNKKTLGIIVAMVLVCVLSVAGTLAYLKATSDQVTNTFVAKGLAKLKLDEAPLKEGTFELDKTKDRVTAVTYDGIYPGATLEKDPTVTVTDLKFDAYLFVEVWEENNTNGTGKYINWETRDNWEAVMNGTTPVTGKNGGQVYRYTGTLAVQDAAQTFPILKDDKVTVGDYDEVPTENPQLMFYAYMSQKAGFDTPLAAWNATFK